VIGCRREVTRIERDLDAFRAVTLARRVQIASAMASPSYQVFPDITLVVDGRPRRITMRTANAPAGDRRERSDRPARRASWWRAMPIFVAAIGIGAALGWMTRPHPPHKDVPAIGIQSR
jgi:hypothetical protein